MTLLDVRRVHTTCILALPVSSWQDVRFDALRCCSKTASKSFKSNWSRGYKDAIPSSILRIHTQEEIPTYLYIINCKSINRSSLAYRLYSVHLLRAQPFVSECVSTQLLPSQPLPKAAPRRLRRAVCTLHTCAPRGSIARPTCLG